MNGPMIKPIKRKKKERSGCHFSNKGNIGGEKYKKDPKGSGVGRQVRMRKAVV